MILGVIRGNVVSTAKNAHYDALKILVVQPVDADRKPAGKSFLAVDNVQAGPGDLVLVNDEGNSARMMLGNPEAPIRTVIVGIVDAVRKDI